MEFKTQDNDYFVGLTAINVMNKNGVLLAELIGHQNEIEQYCLSKDQTKLVTKSNDYDKQIWNIRVWNLEKNVLTHNIEGTLDCIDCLALTNDGRRLIGGFFFANVKIWDLNPNGTAELLTTLNCWQIAEDPQQYQSTSSVDWEFGRNINNYIETFFGNVDKIDIGHVFASNTKELIISDDGYYLTAINNKNRYNKKWDLRTYQEVPL